MSVGTGPRLRKQSVTAWKAQGLLRRAQVTPGSYTESNRKSRAKPLPEGLARFFRKVGDA